MSRFVNIKFSRRIFTLTSHLLLSLFPQPLLLGEFCWVCGETGPLILIYIIVHLGQHVDCVLFLLACLSLGLRRDPRASTGCVTLGFIFARVVTFESSFILFTRRCLNRFLLKLRRLCLPQMPCPEFMSKI